MRPVRASLVVRRSAGRDLNPRWVWGTIFAVTKTNCGQLRALL